MISSVLRCGSRASRGSASPRGTVAVKAQAMQPQVRPDLDSPRRGRPPGIDPSSGGTAHLRRLAKETARDLVAMSTGARTAPNLHARLTVATGARQRGAGQRG